MALSYGKWALDNRSWQGFRLFTLLALFALSAFFLALRPDRIYLPAFLVVSVVGIVLVVVVFAVVAVVVVALWHLHICRALLAVLVHVLRVRFRRARPRHLHAPFCVAKYVYQSVPNDTSNGRSPCSVYSWKNRKK